MNWILIKSRTIKFTTIFNYHIFSIIRTSIKSSTFLIHVQWIQNRNNNSTVLSVTCTWRFTFASIKKKYSKKRIIGVRSAHYCCGRLNDGKSKCFYHCFSHLWIINVWTFVFPLKLVQKEGKRDLYKIFKTRKQHQKKITMNIHYIIPHYKKHVYDQCLRNQQYVEQCVDIS